MGRTVDMSALASKNEQVRAVGNMNVNARGDVLNSDNEVIDDSNQRINRVYNKTVNPRSMSEDITPPQQAATATPVTPIAPKPTNINLEELTELERQFEQLDEDVDNDLPK